MASLVDTSDSRLRALGAGVALPKIRQRSHIFGGRACDLSAHHSLTPDRDFLRRETGRILPVLKLTVPLEQRNHSPAVGEASYVVLTLLFTSLWTVITVDCRL